MIVHVHSVQNMLTSSAPCYVALPCLDVYIEIEFGSIFLYQHLCASPCKHKLHCELASTEETLWMYTVLTNTQCLITLAVKIVPAYKCQRAGQLVSHSMGCNMHTLYKQVWESQFCMFVN